MAYNENIPAAGNPFDDDIPLIQENFSQIQTVFDINHGSLTNVSGERGKHEKVIFGQQGDNPEFLQPSIGLFARTGLYGDMTAAELTLKLAESNKIVIEDWTSAGFSASPGWAFLPNGLIMYWGDLNITTTSSNRSITINFAPNSPTRPPISTIFFADLQLKTLASGPGDQIDAFAWLRRWEINESSFKLFYRLQKRSSFNTPIDESILNVRGSYIAIGI